VEAGNRRLQGSRAGAVLIQEILLLKPEPGVRIVDDRRAAVARVRGAVRQQNLAHHECAIFLRRIRVNGDWLQETVRAVALGLAGRAAVEAPHRELVEIGKVFELFDLGFAAEVRDGLVAVEPDVFQFVLRH
jgi:hypothetical protein